MLGICSNQLTTRRARTNMKQLFVEMEVNSLPRFTDTEVNNCLVYIKSVDSRHQIVPFCWETRKARARNPAKCREVNSSGTEFE